MKEKIFSFYTLAFFLVIPNMSFAQTYTGTIRGKVIDTETKSPIVGATVMVLDTKLGSTTNTEGAFNIQNIPVGSYSVRVNFIGYLPLTKTDIIVRSQRTTEVEVEIIETSLESNEVVVTAGYFNERPDEPTSVTSMSYEEIRRAPGSGGDVSRIILGLPSLAKVNDQSNSLIVRGGSPTENAFFIDGIEVPNINHFPTQGATGGPIGIINVDLINDVTFSAGGFPATYGDKLSSVMELSLREGNKEKYDTQLDLNFAGFGGTAEGPFSGGGSFLLSMRRSYLDLLVKTIDIGTSIVPTYGDVNFKATYPLSSKHTVSILDIFSDDHNNPDAAAAVENKMIFYGNQDIYENTAGITWRALWNNNIYSAASLSYSFSKYKEDWFETNSDVHIVRNRSYEGAIQFRSTMHFKIDDRNTIEAGIEGKNLSNEYDNAYSAYTDALGDSTAQFIFNDNPGARKIGAYVNYIFNPFSRLTLTFGSRWDYFSFNKASVFSPRLAALYQLSELTSLKASTGIYFQDIPLLLLAQNETNKNLKTPRAVHYIIGIDHLLTESTKLSVEVYQKDYDSFPLDPSQPSLFVMDELFYRYGFFFNHNSLTDKGKAMSRGVEIMLQKKLAQNFYGLASASYSTVRYRGDDGVWRNRVFDNRIIFSIEGGYKPNSEWEFSARWIFAGGVPYTPLDIAASQALNRDVLDQTRINAARMPDYHSLNIRADKRFHFVNSNMVTYLSIWNAYNRKNVASYF